MRHVILGNGIAGISAAESLRRLDPEAEITLVGDETGRPYCRPMIAGLLEGSADERQLSIRPRDYYAAQGIRTVLGGRVTALDPAARSLAFRDGRTIPFDRLLIATGADPRPIKAEGLELGNLFFMRTRDQVRGMLDALPAVERALVLGGGLVGFKAAYGLLRRGIPVTMLIRSGHPLSLQVDEAAGRMVLEELRRHGLEVRVGVSVAAFSGNGRVREAAVSDGSRIPCDMVVIGKGVLPALSFVSRGALAVDLGILVDEHLETSEPGIFAAGDVAESVDVARGHRWVNAIWPEAAAQGRIAGMNMAGRRVAYHGSLGRNVIRVFGLDLMTAGVVDPPEGSGCRVISHRDRRRDTYRKVVVRDGRLVGFTLVNDIEQGGVLTALVQGERPLPVDPDRLLEPSFNTSRLMDPSFSGSRP
jgi:NAD(P)H-nitrite reductase large subunit